MLSGQFSITPENFLCYVALFLQITYTTSITGETSEHLFKFPLLNNISLIIFPKRKKAKAYKFTVDRIASEIRATAPVAVTLRSKIDIASIMNKRSPNIGIVLTR